MSQDCGAKDTIGCVCGYCTKKSQTVGFFTPMDIAPGEYAQLNDLVATGKEANTSSSNPPKAGTSEEKG